MTVSLDCSWDDAVFLEEGLDDLINGVDLFLPNEAEAERLRKRGVPVPTDGVTVIKKGAGGAQAHHAGERFLQPAQTVEVVDTTGAGDAFNAGFMHVWLDGVSIVDSLEAGVACGAIAVGHVGGATGLRELDLLKSWDCRGFPSIPRRLG